MDIQPIETLYADTLFRSRLEARWAVYFDALGIPWEYEPNTYRRNSGGLYLPDFSLFRGDLFAEVKPNGGSFKKAHELDACVLLLEAVPAEPAIYRTNNEEYVYIGHRLAYEKKREDLLREAYDEFENGQWLPNPIMLRAVRLARSERFGAHAPRHRHLLSVSERVEKFGVRGPLDLAYLCDLCVSEADLHAVEDYISEPRWNGCASTCTVCGYGMGDGPRCSLRCGHAADCEYREACQRICPDKAKFDGKGCLIPEGTYKARGISAEVCDDTVTLMFEYHLAADEEDIFYREFGRDEGFLACTRLLGWSDASFDDLGRINGTLDAWFTVQHFLRPDGKWSARLLQADTLDLIVEEDAG